MSSEDFLEDDDDWEMEEYGECDGCGCYFADHPEAYFTVPEYPGRAWCDETCYRLNPPE
jgi:hypothetical protein